MPRRAAPQQDFPLQGCLPSELVGALLERIIRRVPKAGKKDEPGEVCPYTGLNRSALYELFKLRKDGRPVIKTFSLKQKGEKHGSRFYYPGSVLRHLDQLADEQADESPPKLSNSDV